MTLNIKYQLISVSANTLTTGPWLPNGGRHRRLTSQAIL